MAYRELMILDWERKHMKSLKNVEGDIMIATVKDTWGNIIGFIYNPEFQIKEN